LFVELVLGETTTLLSLPIWAMGCANSKGAAAAKGDGKAPPVPKEAFADSPRPGEKADQKGDPKSPKDGGGKEAKDGGKKAKGDGDTESEDGDKPAESGDKAAKGAKKRKTAPGAKSDEPNDAEKHGKSETDLLAGKKGSVGEGRAPRAAKKPRAKSAGHEPDPAGSDDESVDILDDASGSVATTGTSADILSPRTLPPLGASKPVIEKQESLASLPFLQPIERPKGHTPARGGTLPSLGKAPMAFDVKFDDDDDDDKPKQRRRPRSGVLERLERKRPDSSSSRGDLERRQERARRRREEEEKARTARAARSNRKVGATGDQLRQLEQNKVAQLRQQLSHRDRVAGANQRLRSNSLNERRRREAERVEAARRRAQDIKARGDLPPPPEEMLGRGDEKEFATRPDERPISGKSVLSQATAPASRMVSVPEAEEAAPQGEPAVDAHEE
jgi:hypothetical protein